MTRESEIRVGIIGVGGRPRAFLRAIEECPYARLVAACDIDSESMAAALTGIEDIRRYTEYVELLESDVDAVIVGTPIHLHASQSTEALDRGIHVLSEVAAGVTVEECITLVRAARASSAKYMLAENCNYMRPYMTIREMVRASVFGEVYYAEGEYLHNCTVLSERTPWRLEWIYGRDGITYGTHSLGPVLSWFAGDRVVRVSCEGSGRHYLDPRSTNYTQEDTCVMLAKTEMERLIKIRLDVVSSRPYNLGYVLQGTRGAYHSGRFRGEPHMVCLPGDDRSDTEVEWVDLESLFDEYTPEAWRRFGSASDAESHGGSDYILMMDFLESIYYDRPVPIGIDAAMDMTLPGLMSQQSIAQNGAWLDVADSRSW
jgi:predicted dehydrogenase